MATFKINKRYSVTRDKYQWILLLDDRPHKYYQSLENLFEYLLRLKISESKALEVNQLINSINKARTGFNRLSTMIENRFESDKLEVKNE